MKKNYLSYVLLPVLLFFLSEFLVFPRQPVNTLKVGAKVPEFTLNDQNGKTFDIRNVLGKENLVIYFYVKDETPGCTTESCTFRDNYEVFKQAKAMIIGISAQSVESHKKFADKYNLPFALLSDPDNIVRKMFGVQTGGYGALPGRVTFVVDKTGKIVDVFDSLTKPVQHVTEAMNILKNLK